MSKYGVFSGPYFPVVRMGKIQARKNSVFGHFSRSVSTMFQWTPNVKELCEHYYWSVLSKEIQKKKTIKHPKKLFVVTLSCCVCQWANPQKDNFRFRTCGKMCALAQYSLEYKLSTYGMRSQLPDDLSSND